MMFYVKLWCKRGKVNWVVEKELNWGLRENWKYVMRFYNEDVVLWGSVWDEVNLCCWEWEKGGRIVRVDRG